MSAPTPSSRPRRVRWWLGAGLLLAVVMALLVKVAADRMLSPPIEWQFGDAAELDLLRRYVRIDTRTGREIDGARWLAERLWEAGLEPRLEPLADGRANLWAILEGEDPEALVLLNHIDVSEISDEAEWRRPPFAAELDGPWLYGRGSFDMKSLAIAQLTAITRLAAGGRRPQRSLVFLATSEEESGSVLGVRWLLARHPELMERFWAVLTEGGVVEAVNPTTVKYWGIEFAQKTIIPVTFCSSSRQRLEELRTDISEWTSFPADPRLTPEVARFLVDYAPSRARRRTRNHLGDPEALFHNLRGFYRLPPYLRSMFRDEAAAFLVEPQADGGFALRVYLMLLSGADAERELTRLLAPWITHGVTVRVAPALPAGDPAPADHPVFQRLRAELVERFPGVRVGGYFQSTSGTDARFFRQAGIPAYGFSPFIFFSTDTLKVGRVNERVGVQAYLSGLELYVDLVGRLVE